MFLHVFLFPSLPPAASTAQQRNRTPRIPLATVDPATAKLTPKAYGELHLMTVWKPSQVPGWGAGRGCLGADGVGWDERERSSSVAV